MKLIKYLFYFGLVLILFGCPIMDSDIAVDSKITVVNNSDERLIVHYEFNQPADTALSDLSFPINSLNYGSRIVEPKSEIILYSYFNEYFDKAGDGIVMIYLFSPDTIDFYPWSEIVQGNHVLKRFDLNESDLDSLEWYVYFPD